MSIDQIQYFHHNKLHHHPRNMRRIYPQRDVEQMADSIMARGIIEPLIATREDGKVFVVAGNLRLRAARWLGDDAPSLPVIIRDRGQADQLLDMAAENLIRADIDVVSEAFHYQTLIEEEGMTKTAIAREVGVSLARINERLLILELNPEIQQLMAEQRLPHGTSVVEALLGIPDDDIRIEAAERLARKRASVQTIKSVCTRIRHALERNMNIEEAQNAGREYIPAVEAIYAEDVPPDGQAIVTWENIRTATTGPCGSCDAYEYRDGETPDPNRAWESFEATSLSASINTQPVPTWSEVEKVTGATCVACGLRDDHELCGRCPMVEFMQRLVREVNRREE